MDFSRIKKVYIIGIEGCGTSALARLLKGLGRDVSGSDEGDHYYHDMLKDADIKVSHKFDCNNVPLDADLIVRSLAFKPENNEEAAFASERKMKMMTYGEALGVVFNQCDGIAVCGSHGKTTTSAWLAFVLEQSGVSPNAVIGSKVPQFNGNNLIGHSNYLVIEADEYGNKLQYLNPKGVLLNNVDYDHPDVFKSVTEYEDVFREFIGRLSAKSFAVVNFDDKAAKKIAETACKGKIISYALDEAADYVAYNIRQADGRQIFSVKIGSDLIENGDVLDAELGEFSVRLIGRHNIYNALAVIAAAIEIGVALVDVRKALEDFEGTTKRMERMGEYRGAEIYTDYAHHPTEVRTTLEGFRQKFPRKKIITVFHPHTYTRTLALLDDFAKSFRSTDELVILDIYGSAREQQGGVHSLDLLKKIQDFDRDSSVKYIPTVDECVDYLKKEIGSGDALMLMGAGDAFRIGEKLIGD